MSSRASKPAGDVPFSDPPSPVTSVMYAMVIGAGAADAVTAVVPTSRSGRPVSTASVTGTIVERRRIDPPRGDRAAGLIGGSTSDLPPPGSPTRRSHALSLRDRSLHLDRTVVTLPTCPQRRESPARRRPGSGR